MTKRNQSAGPGDALAPGADREHVRQGLTGELNEWSSWLDEQIDNAAKGPDPEEAGRWARAVSRWVIDATLLADAESLQAGLGALRTAYTRFSPAEARGNPLEPIMMVLAETTQAALDRARQIVLEESIEPDTWAARMLVAIHDQPDSSNTQLAETLRVSDMSQISRSGRVLSGSGLAVSTRHGRENAWRTTPRGARVVEQLLVRTMRVERYAAL